MVRALTGFEPFFAEEVQDLIGLDALCTHMSLEEATLAAFGSANKIGLEIPSVRTNRSCFSPIITAPRVLLTMLGA